MTQYTFLERVTHISISEGIVKLELATLHPDENPDANALTRPPDLRLAMSLPGFLRVYTQMSHVVGKLVEQNQLHKPSEPNVGQQNPESPTINH